MIKKIVEKSAEATSERSKSGGSYGAWSLHSADRYCSFLYREDVSRENCFLLRITAEFTLIEIKFMLWEKKNEITII